MAKDGNKSGFMQGAVWWAMLVIAVLAVPSFGFIVSHESHASGLAELVVFVLACWFCTFLGMRLMNSSALSRKDKE
jgi:hypothetical protein